MPEKHRRYFLKEKEAKALLNQASEKLRATLEALLKGRVAIEVDETDFGKIFLVNGKPLLAKVSDVVYPTLLFDEFLAGVAKVVVDMGAIPYICKGANVMAPGIRHFDEGFKKGDFVLIVDEKHGKAIAVGEILYDAQEARHVKQGVVVRNIHYVGDKIWDFVKESYHKV